MPLMPYMHCDEEATKRPTPPVVVRLSDGPSLAGLLLLLAIAVIANALAAKLARSAGLSRGDHFTVIAPADADAQTARDNAESFRAEFAREWGIDVPTDVRTVISMRFSATEHSGLTLARDHAAQHYHNVFLCSTRDNALGPMLRHEVAHTVLATAYPLRLPSCVEEGIACRYDCEKWRKLRSEERFTPRIAELLDAREVDYAAAESLVEYLLTLGDKQTLLHFADSGQRNGWDASALECYQRDVGQLEKGWREWLEVRR